MTNLATRRRFFGNALATASLLEASALAGTDATHAEGEDYYDKLGVTKIINAAGTYTMFTASIMPPSVQAAVAKAAKHPVRLAELQKKAGEYIARKLKCEADLVSAGAASALTLGTAACMTVANRKAAEMLPSEVSGLKNEVIVQKTHRYGYDHAMKNCGVRFVEVETLDEYDRAFTDRTVMCHFFNAAEQGQISREDWIRIAHKHGVPCFNDAAADVPPISNLWTYTQMGFDLVTFSGGKGLRGPQCTGLLLGRKNLIDMAKKNNSPNSNTIGRGLKVAKEEIVGLVAAVDWFLAQDDAAMDAEFQRRAERIAGELKGLPTVETKIFIPAVANHVPHLLITYDPSRIQITGAEVMQKMRQGKPRIELNPGTGGAPASAGLPGGPNTIVVGVWMMQAGDDVIVAKRLREVLQGA